MKYSDLLALILGLAILALPIAGNWNWGTEESGFFEVAKSSALGFYNESNLILAISAIACSFFAGGAVAICFRQRSKVRVAVTEARDVAGALKHFEVKDVNAMLAELRRRKRDVEPGEDKPLSKQGRKIYEEAIGHVRAFRRAMALANIPEHKPVEIAG